MEIKNKVSWALLLKVMKFFFFILGISFILPLIELIIENQSMESIKKGHYHVIPLKYLLKMQSEKFIPTAMVL